MYVQKVYCDNIDNSVEHVSCLRIIIIMIFVIYKVIIKSESWKITNIWKSFLMYITHEGIGMAIYFCISFLMDISTILLHHDNYCKYQVLIATYSIACIIFLSNALFALCYQEKWYNNGNNCWKCIFIIICIFLTICFFCFCIIIVFYLNYINIIVFFLSKFYYSVVISICFLIFLDLFQSFVLTLVANNNNNLITVSDSD
jgi:hypothetical protein